jgi:transposase InsO family protein
MDVLRQHLEERPTAERSPTKLGEAVGLSRVTIWRQLRQPSTTRHDELELRSQIQTIALEMRTYGYRPITAELHRRGVKVNRKRVLRLLREDNLLCLRQRAFVRTTDSRHNLTVYPNLTRNLALSNINQLWVADITYIRLLREFIYLAVLLDAFSRRCIGWGHLAPPGLTAVYRDTGNEGFRIGGYGAEQTHHFSSSPRRSSPISTRSVPNTQHSTKRI